MWDAVQTIQLYEVTVVSERGFLWITFSHFLKKKKNKTKC